MQPSTQREYQRLAEHFYARRLDGKLSPKRIQDALRSVGSEYRPAYWRRLRKAIEVDQRIKGYGDAADRIADTVNPATADGATEPPKAKQRRCRRVTEEDTRALAHDAERRGDEQMIAALVWARKTGLRPAEMPHARILDDGTVRIEGAKKSHEGKRGADRDLRLDADDLRNLRAYQDDLPKTAAEVGRLQRRMQNVVRDVFPRRKARPSLYSWRHQLGSDLKAAGLDREEIATIMGHQGTGSVDQYGNRRSAGQCRAIPRAAAVNPGVRHTHNLPYSQQPEREPAPVMDVDDDPMREPTPSRGHDLGV